MSDHENRPHDAEEDAPLGLPAPQLALAASPRLQTVRAVLPAKNPVVERETDSGGGIAGYLHAFRRRWLVAMTLGLIGGGAAAATTYLLAPTKFTASALIRVSADNPKLIFKIDDSHSSFDIYKETQMQLLTGDFVLNKALGMVPDAETLKQEEDPLRFLAKALQIDSPGKTEILRVSLTALDKSEAAAIVNAVVTSYMNEVVGKERDDREGRVTELNRAYTEKEGMLRAKRVEYKNLTDRIGSGDAGTLAIKQQLAAQQYGEARAELNRLRTDLQKARIAKELKSQALKARKERPADSPDVDIAMSTDQRCVSIQNALADLDIKVAEVRKVMKGGGLKSSLDEIARGRAILEEQLSNRRQQLADRLTAVRSGVSGSLESEIKELKALITLLESQETQAEQILGDQKKQTELLGTSSVDVEMMRAELQGLERVLTAIDNERQELQVEKDSKPRIKLVQVALPPSAPDKSSRLQNTITFGLLGFLAPVGLLLWWDVRGRRINSISDVSDGLGLTVIGTVPHISTRRTASGMGLRRHRQMQVCLDHSIDGIAAKLFLRRDARGGRVVLVSSATRGEGKSTLSIQLAKRLALTGASTLLVDFDLRKPSLHHVFDAPRGPGLTEFLRGGSDLGTLVRPTDVDNLSILTSGSPFTDSLGTLSNGVTRSLFDQVRKDFDFVIVDGSPILPVVDALLTSQHVDAVVLSVRRDVSQAHRVKAACEQLAAFGVEEYFAVLTGTSEDFYYYGNDEQFALEDRPLPR